MSTKVGELTGTEITSLRRIVEYEYRQFKSGVSGVIGGRVQHPIPFFDECLINMAVFVDEWIVCISSIFLV